MLLLAHKFLAFFQTVRLALDVNDSAVMQDAVQDGGGDGDIGKDLVPLGEGLVGGKDGGRLLISPGNQLEEQVCALDVHGEAADLVDDKHPVLGENLELVRQTVLKMGLLELLNKLYFLGDDSGHTVRRDNIAIAVFPDIGAIVQNMCKGIDSEGLPAHCGHTQTV